MPTAERPLIVQGMHGLGDNLHQRAVLRELLKRHATVWLETPWPAIYHDLPVKLAAPATRLRTQADNVRREVRRYHGRLPLGEPGHRIWYRPEQVREQGGFLAAMCKASGVPKGDFSLPVLAEWTARAQVRLAAAGWRGEPVVVYRPLVERTEWPGCAARNPDALAYVTLFEAIAARCFVVSVADLVPKVEWLASPPVDADATFHKGELRFEELAGLVKLARLVFCSPGFMLVLAQAVRAPLVGVFGGHESARLYAHGFAENHWIQPVQPCECFSKAHACRKAIDMPAALAGLNEFVRRTDAAAGRCAEGVDRLDRLAEAVPEPGRAGDAGHAHALGVA